MRTRGRVPTYFASLVAAVLFSAAPAHAQDEPATATFVTNYDVAVPAQARSAVDAATRIWSARIHSPVPIEVDVEWGGGLPRNVAAAAEPTTYQQVSPGAPLLPVALANAVTGYDHDPGAADIRLRLGAGISWYTGTDGAVPANATDMVSMVLHELCHGLGFMGSFGYDGRGQLRWGRATDDGIAPVALDSGLIDIGTGNRLIDAAAFANPSDELLAVATSGRVVWGAGARDSRGQPPVVYAPRAYEPHSSLMHFDDDAYPAGDPDALMTSLIRRGEVAHRVGPAALGVLADLGWKVNGEKVSPLTPPQSAATTPAVVVTAPPPPTPSAPMVAASAEAPLVAVKGSEIRTQTSATRPVAATGGTLFILTVAVALAFARRVVERRTVLCPRGAGTPKTC